MFKLLKNPFYIYVIGFIFTFLVYTLEWSSIYPDLTLDIKIFFGVTFVIFLFLGILIDKLGVIKTTKAQTSVKLLLRGVRIIYFFYFLEILYEGDFPLLAKLIGREGIDYQEFGIPLLHGVLISFNSFLIAHSFSVYMSTKNKKVLRYNLYLYIPALLIINRSIIVFGLLTSVFIFIHFVGKVKIKNQIRLIILGFIGLYFFGIIGNLRSGGDFIYTQSKATPEFMNSSVPVEYYWTYLYVASPLANFQNTINEKEITNYDFKGFVFYENLPRIISKNLGGPLGIERRDLVRIVPWLTVGTTYARSFSYLDWLGPYLLFISSLFIYIIVLLSVPRKSSYHITTIAVLSVVIFLNIFTNMLIVTGISFQLVYCIIFAFFERKKIIYRK